MPLHQSLIKYFHSRLFLWTPPDRNQDEETAEGYNYNKDVELANMFSARVDHCNSTTMRRMTATTPPPQSVLYDNYFKSMSNMDLEWFSPRRNSNEENGMFQYSYQEEWSYNILCSLQQQEELVKMILTWAHSCCMTSYPLTLFFFLNSYKQLLTIFSKKEQQKHQQFLFMKKSSGQRQRRMRNRRRQWRILSKYLDSKERKW